MDLHGERRRRLDAGDEGAWAGVVSSLDRCRNVFRCGDHFARYPEGREMMAFPEDFVCNLRYLAPLAVDDTTVEYAADDTDLDAPTLDSEVSDNSLVVGIEVEAEISPK